MPFSSCAQSHVLDVTLTTGLTSEKYIHGSASTLLKEDLVHYLWFYRPCLLVQVVF